MIAQYLDIQTRDSNHLGTVIASRTTDIMENDITRRTCHRAHKSLRHGPLPRPVGLRHKLESMTTYKLETQTPVGCVVQVLGENGSGEGR